MTFGGLIAFVIFSLLSWQIANFLHIDSIMLIIWIGILFFICWALSVNLGLMQGLQRFNHLALMNFLPALLKIIISGGLVLIGFGIYGAIGGLVLGIFANFIISFYLLRDIIRWSVIKTFFNIRSANVSKSNSDTDLSQITDSEINTEIKNAFRFSFPVLLMTACIAIPTNIDLILIKHFFTSVDAGLFTAVSVFGKMVLAVSVAITTVMYPKIVEAHVKNDKTRGLLNRSLFYTLLPVGLAAILFYLLPKFLLGIFYGDEYLEAEILLKYYGIFIFFFSLVTVFLYNSLANNRYRFVYLFVVFSIFELVLIWFYHYSLIFIIQILLVMSVIMLIIGFIENYSYNFIKSKF
jgi:O-antigen/teichoic acid export membrane protein